MKKYKKILLILILVPIILLLLFIIYVRINSEINYFKARKKVINYIEDNYEFEYEIYDVYRQDTFDPWASLSDIFYILDKTNNIKFSITYNISFDELEFNTYEEEKRGKKVIDEISKVYNNNKYPNYDIHCTQADDNVYFCNLTFYYKREDIDYDFVLEICNYLYKKYPQIVICIGFTHNKNDNNGVLVREINKNIISSKQNLTKFVEIEYFE